MTDILAACYWITGDSIYIWIMLIVLSVLVLVAWLWLITIRSDLIPSFVPVWMVLLLNYLIGGVVLFAIIYACAGILISDGSII
jgi:hypothetical protein